MGNPFVHVELMSTDVGKAKAFYGKLFEAERGVGVGRLCERR